MKSDPNVEYIAIITEIEGDSICNE